jgi:hypothetical protein
MDAQALFLARALLWLLFVCTVFAPLRWSFFCLIVASHVDIVTASFMSGASVGFENAVRIVGFPLVLLVKMHFSPLKRLNWTITHKLWIALVVYAAVAASWTDYRLSAFKMVIYLADYFVFYCIFAEAWRCGVIGFRTIRSATWAVLLLAFVQTYLLGNPVGTEGRLTTFTTAQYFAAYLLAVLAILVFSEESGWFHYLTCIAIVAAIILSGSRYIFVSAVLLFVAAGLRGVLASGRRINIGSLAIRVVPYAAIVAFGVLVVLNAFPESRIQEVSKALSSQNASVEDVGTFAWRLKVYSAILDRLDSRSPGMLVFGSGTSSGARLMFELEPGYYTETGEEGVDGNRVLHSEFLRSLYEWGILGFGLLSVFLLSLCVAFTRRVLVQGSGPALAFIGVLPSILFGLAIENILGGAASASGVGILLVISFAWIKGLSIKGAPVVSA